jgi:hypothetical protein
VPDVSASPITSRQAQQERFAAAFTGLERLRAVPSTEAFWRKCLAVLADVFGARLAVLLREGPRESPGWLKVLVRPANAAVDEAAQGFFRVAGDLAEAAVQHGGIRRPDSSMSGEFLLAVRWQLPPPGRRDWNAERDGAPLIRNHMSKRTKPSKAATEAFTKFA